MRDELLLSLTEFNYLIEQWNDHEFKTEDEFMVKIEEVIKKVNLALKMK